MSSAGSPITLHVLMRPSQKAAFLRLLSSCGVLTQVNSRNYGLNLISTPLESGDTPLVDLGLFPNRTLNALQVHGIVTVGDLTARSLGYLSQLEGIGPVHQRNISYCVNEAGLALAPDNHSGQIETLADFSVREIKTLHHHRIYTIADLCSLTLVELTVLNEVGSHLRRKILTALKQHGLRLQPNPPLDRSTDAETPTLAPA